MDVGVRWRGRRVGGIGWGGCGGPGGYHIAIYAGLLGARGRCAPFYWCSLRRDWRWWDRKGVGLEEGVCSLLVGVPQWGFCRCLHDRLPISTMLLRGRCLAYHFFIGCSILDSDTQAELPHFRSFPQGRWIAHLCVHNMQCIRNCASQETWCKVQHTPWIACKLWARTRDP